jgi:hypothetical protein
MPYDEADASDPLMLVGVQLPCEEGAGLEIVRVFAEEFARIGFDEARLMELFRNPFYAGPHGALRSLGEERVREEVRRCLEVWGRLVYRERDADPESGMPLLPVLDRPAEAGRRQGHG